ncbi:cytochrome c oxidase subunit II [bacterium]|nr:cytochrome c oxidase subunit II [bacterium]
MKGILSNPLLAQGFWMPVKGSSMAGEVDWIFQFILWVALFFFVLVVGIMAVFVMRYRRRPGVEPEESPSHNTKLEIVWSVIPIILVMIMFYAGFKTYLGMETPPRSSHEVQVVGQKWQWTFIYPNGYSDPVLHLPIDEPVQLLMRSDDVIHSFFVPAFRVKKDVVPGRFTKAWFEPNLAGVFPVYCAEYCGTGHSDMTTAVVVHEPGGFEEWMATAANLYADLPPAEAGKMLYAAKGCTACHSIDGTKMVGPSFKSVFGKTETMKSGENITVDENYLRESIYNPQVKVLEGYEPVMPTYQGTINDEELGYIIEFIKSLAE